MWNPPIALTLEEQKMAARPRKTRKFFVLLRARRHEILDADLQNTLAKSSSPEPKGKAPVDVGLLALALLLQAYGNVGDRDAVALTVMAKRWQMVLDGLDAEQPPFSQGTLCNFRMRLMAHNLDKTPLDRTVVSPAGGYGHDRPDGRAGYRAGPRGGPRWETHQAAGGPRSTDLHRGQGHAPRPHEQCQNVQWLPGARCPGSGQHSDARGGGLPGERAGICGRGVGSRGTGGWAGLAAAGHRSGGHGPPAPGRKVGHS